MKDRLKDLTVVAALVILVFALPGAFVFSLFYSSYRADLECEAKGTVSVTLTHEPDLEHIVQTSGSYSDHGPCKVRIKVRDKDHYDEVRRNLLDAGNKKEAK